MAVPRAALKACKKAVQSASSMVVLLAAHLAVMMADQLVVPRVALKASR
jgi:hypothetical protein